MLTVDVSPCLGSNHDVYLVMNFKSYLLYWCPRNPSYDLLCVNFSSLLKVCLPEIKKLILNVDSNAKDKTNFITNNTTLTYREVDIKWGDYRVGRRKSEKITYFCTGSAALISLYQISNLIINVILTALITFPTTSPRPHLFLSKNQIN